MLPVMVDVDYRIGVCRGEVAGIKVDLPVNAHLPHDYVTSDRLRPEAYGRLAADADAAVAEELRDRYSAPPEPVGNLIEVARFRALARQLGITEVSLQGSAVRITPGQLCESLSVDQPGGRPRLRHDPMTRSN